MVVIEPHNAQNREAEQISYELRHEADDLLQLPLIGYRQVPTIRHFYIEHHNGYQYRNDTVAEGFDTVGSDGHMLCYLVER